MFYYFILFVFILFFLFLYDCLTFAGFFFTLCFLAGLNLHHISNQSFGFQLPRIQIQIPAIMITSPFKQTSQDHFFLAGASPRASTFYPSPCHFFGVCARLTQSCLLFSPILTLVTLSLCTQSLSNSQKLPCTLTVPSLLPTPVLCSSSLFPCNIFDNH